MSDTDCSLPCLIEKIATTLRYCNLKDKQIQAIHEFMKGKGTPSFLCLQGMASHFAISCYRNFLTSCEVASEA